MMRFARLIYILFLFFTLIENAFAEHSLMITAFEPFDGSDANWSTNIAKVVLSKISSPDTKVKICILPVVYDEAATKAEACYNEMDPKPDIVTSLGEGGCDIRLETAAQNRDSTSGVPDNKGTLRTGSSIDGDGPSQIAFKPFVIGLYCSANSQLQSSIQISSSPGGFVCNNTAYHLGLFFDKLNVPYSFIHVPNHDCAFGNSGEAMIQNAGTQLSEILKNNLSVNKIITGEYKKMCSSLPTTEQELDQFKQIMSLAQDGLTQKCEEDFFAKLKERFGSWKPKDSSF